MQPLGQIASIYRYPVKSMAGEAIEQSWLTESGLEGDRLYAFASSGAPAGMLRLTGLERRQMLLYHPVLRADGKVEVRVPTGEPLLVDSPEMLSHLATHIADTSRFTLTQSAAPQTDVRPLSLISRQTMEKLSAGLGKGIDDRRFRANLYLDLAEGALHEDKLVGQTLRIGSTAIILVRERIPRCRFITYDPESPIASDPLFALMKLLDREHQTRAGVYATIEQPGPIKAGDRISLA